MGGGAISKKSNQLIRDEVARYNKQKKCYFDWFWYLFSTGFHLNANNNYDNILNLKF